MGGSEGFLMTVSFMVLFASDKPALPPGSV